MKAVPILSLGEAFVSHMALRGKSSDAVLRDVTMVLLKEAFVSLMAQRGSDAASTGVPNEPIQEESASLMAQRLRVNDAVLRDVPTLSKREGFVSHMEQWSSDADMRDVTMVLL
jgi:hypothetical protein